MTKTKTYKSADIKKLPGSMMEITSSIDSETLEQFRNHAIEHLNKNISVPGFRKGMVPENIIISKFGEMAVLEEMAEHAIGQAYYEIILDNKIDAIGKPEIKITKLAKNNPLEFIILTAVVPEITLPDYKKISADIVKKQNADDVKVTDKDLENTINNILKASAPTKKDSSSTEDLPNVSEGHNNTIIAPNTKSGSDMTNLPALTDDFVKTLGAFSSVADFKEKIKGVLASEKKDKAIEKTRIEIADAIADKTNMEIPSLFIESETERIEASFNEDIEKMGVKLEDYLKHAKKTVDELREEWKPHAEKKAKLQLLINAIADKENLRPTPDEVAHEVKHLVEHYKDADPERIATYAETVLTNEKVFRFLESQK